MRIVFLLGMAMVFSTPASARVFSFKKENVASYFRFNGGVTTLGSTPFQETGGSGLTFSDEYRYNYAGEIGFLFGLGAFSLRAGLDLLSPGKVTQAEAKNAAGTVLYKQDSSIFGVGGGLHLEIPFGATEHFRGYASIGGGYSQVTLKNTYAFTADGTAAYGVADYIEEGGAPSYFGQFAFGFEALMSDNVTFMMDLGYRQQVVQALQHSREATGINGAVSPGSNMKTNAGSDVALNLSGAFVGLGFRFYINLL